MESRLNIKNYNCVPFLCLFGSLTFGYSVFAQAPKGFGGRPPAKKHKVIQSGTLKLVPNSINLSRPNQVEIKIVGERRNIVSNGIPSHEVGQFPNCGNPHQISEQKYSFRPEVKPRWTGDRQRLRSGQSFGVAINGIPFDPLPPSITSGVRFGSAAGTTRGFYEKEFELIGNFIADVLDGFKDNESDVEKEKFIYGFSKCLCSNWRTS